MSETVLSATLFAAEDLRVIETPTAPLAPGMVRVQFGAGGICGSDMHYFRHGRTGDFVVKSPSRPRRQSTLPLPLPFL